MHGLKFFPRWKNESDCNRKQQLFARHGEDIGSERNIVEPLFNVVWFNQNRDSVVKSINGRRGFFCKNNERGSAALFIAKDSAEQERKIVFAAEKNFLFVLRPFVKTV